MGRTGGGITSLRDVRTPESDRGMYRPPTGATSMGPEAPGISMMRPPMLPGVPPSCIDRFFPRRALKTFITAICVFNLIMFVITLIVGAARFDGAFVSENKMLGPGGTTLLWMGGKWEPDIRNKGQIWLLVSPIWLHAGVLHIASNTFCALRFGYVLEARWKLQGLIPVYFLTGIGASLLSCLMLPFTVSVGASGALFGLFGADLIYLAYNWPDIPDRGMELILLVVLTAINLLMGTGDGVDNWAHLGGLVTGLFCGVAMLPRITVRKEETILRVASGVATVVWLLALMLFLWVGDPGN